MSSPLHHKKVLLGVTGSIAAYKAAELTRLLVKAGAEVRVIMSRGGMEFITPMTLQALSGHPVHHDLLDPEQERAMGHIELARWADVLLIAPAGANTLARIVHGEADDLLSAVVLATRSPVLFAPAMNQAMWAAPATRDNLALLAQRGFMQLGPASGEQACGELGLGRMLEPQALLEELEDLFSDQGLLQDIDITITAGPTREAIDPVRYLSNHSSGKMGFAVAEAAQRAGARVRLVAGPVQLPTPAGVERVDVNSAEEMLAAVQAAPGRIFIATAAVADYRPAQVVEQKIKKSAETLSLELVRNPDILATIAARPQPPFCVGFAAETTDVEHYARGKLEAKKLAMIAANLVGPAAGDGGFGSDQNRLQVFWPGGEQDLGQAGKRELARQLIRLIAQRYRDTQPS